MTLAEGKKNENMWTLTDFKIIGAFYMFFLLTINLKLRGLYEY